jgi:hypothetical protein
MSEIENYIYEMYNQIDKAATAGGYREKVELLQVLEDMSWFDNFGEPLYRQRLRVAKTHAENVQEDDIPEFLLEELAGLYEEFEE